MVPHFPFEPKYQIFLSLHATPLIFHIETNMEWNNGIFSPPPFLSESSSSAFLYNYNDLDNHFPAGPEFEIMKQAGVEAQQIGVEKKRRLSNDQLEVLERSFREEVKLDPDRKMKLSIQLGLQPKQIAVWFQNRRARWKAKQLEHLYDTLKQEFDTISKEKHNLQQEVMKLRSILLEQASRNHGSAANYTDVSGEETVESTSVGVRSCCNNYIYNVAEDFNQISASASASASPFWGAAHQLPSYP